MFLEDWLIEQGAMLGSECYRFRITDEKQPCPEEFTADA